MDTKYTKDDLERILFKLESSPTDGMQDRIDLIKVTLEQMNREQPDEDKPDEQQDEAPTV